MAVCTYTHTEILLNATYLRLWTGKKLLTMRNQFHKIPVEMRKINNKHSKIYALLKLLDAEFKAFLHHKKFKQNFNCLCGTPI